MSDKSFPDMTMVIQAMPPELREPMQRWWQAFKTYAMTNLFTQGDVTAITSGKGIIITNAAGTITKRVRLNDIGDGFIIEDV